MYPKQRDYVTVYEMNTPQNKFDDHGLCVLEPSVCEITEEFNGTYELYIEHPFDELGKWKALTEHNIIKAGGQLFRIVKKKTKLSSSGEKVRSVNALHIFYDFNSKLIKYAKTDGGGHAAYWFLRLIFDNIYYDDPQNKYPFYNFNWSTDFGDEVRWAEFKNTSVTAALMGSGSSFVNVYGAELYRNNFEFSLNKRRKNAVDDAFDITYGIDMIDIEENIDFTNFCSKLVASDNYGHQKELALSSERLPTIPHEFVKGVQFNYSEDNWERFQADAQAYFNKVYLPAVSYKVSYADLSNSDLYAGFNALKRCEVGDEGNIYCEELGISTKQRIVKKVTDVLENETVSIELSNVSNSLVRQNLFTNLIAPVSHSETDGYFELMKR